MRTKVIFRPSIMETLKASAVKGSLSLAARVSSAFVTGLTPLTGGMSSGEGR